jgi:hypothetical protein
MATFASPAPDMRVLYTALQGDQEAIDRFIGLITEATSPADFSRRSTCNVSSHVLRPRHTENLCPHETH